MAETFKCPNCGGPIQYDGGTNVTVQCPFCNQSAVVPEELRPQKAATTATSGSNITGDQEAKLQEFVALMRAGRQDEAARMFHDNFGTDLSSARASLAGLVESGELQQFLSVIGMLQAARSGGWANNQSQNYPASRDLPRMRRRRSGGFGCLIFLIILFIAMSIAITGTPLGLLSIFNPKGKSTDFNSALATPLAGIKAFIQSTEINNSLPASSTVITPDIPDILQAVKQTTGFGSLIYSFGKIGNTPGSFEDSRSIALDGKGRIYTAEYTGGRIQVFTPKGQFVNQWMVDAKMPLTALAVDRNGVAYVIQSGKINRYDASTGKLLGQLKSPNGDHFIDLVVNPQGGLAATSFQATDDIVLFDSSGQVLNTIKSAISSQTGEPELDMKLAMDGLGDIYALGTFNSKVFRFNQEGKFVSQFGGQGDGNGQFQAPEAIAVDSQERVYVSDIKGVQVFNAQGNYLDVIKPPVGLAPFGLAIDSFGNLHISYRTQVDVVKIPG